MTRRLLIFGINYAPEPTGIGLNTTWWSETTTRLGWETSVVTGVPHYPSWRRGDVPARRLHGQVNVIHKPHYVPRRQSAARRGAYEATWVLSSLPELSRRYRPDGILGVIPSLGGAVLAQFASVRHHVPYALLFQDLMGKAAGLSGMPGAGRVAGVVRTIELALARRAAGIAVVGEGFRSYFVEGGIPEQRIFRVRNPARLSPALEDRETVRKRLGWEGRFVVLHSGSMGYKQGLDTAVRAAALRAGDPDLLFVFQGDGNQRDALGDLVTRLGVRGIRFLPLASEQELGSVLAAADVLLLNQRGSVKNMSLPAKLASYFAAGIPVIAAVSDDDETAAEIRRARAGLIVAPDDARALLEGIATLRADPGLAARLGGAGTEFAKSHLDESAVVGLVEEFLAAVFVSGGNQSKRRDLQSRVPAGSSPATPLGQRP